MIALCLGHFQVARALNDPPVKATDRAQADSLCAVCHCTAAGHYVVKVFKDGSWQDPVVGRHGYPN